jgi:hypothetical protein
MSERLFSPMDDAHDGAFTVDGFCGDPTRGAAASCSQEELIGLASPVVKNE